LKGKLKTILSNQLESTQLKKIYKTYDIVGNIAIIRVPHQVEHHSKLIAETIMNTHREVKSIWRQTSSVSGDFRLRRLEFVLGKKSTQTRYKEHGCIYKTDLRKTYFSPRLSYERLRIAKLVQKEEIVMNMFSGVGCYSIAIAKHSKAKKVFSVDINSAAIQFLHENISINKVEEVVVPFQGDSRIVITEKLQKMVDRVIMPLPEKAYEYLDYALIALKPAGGWIHYYDFEYAKKGQNPIRKIEKKISEKMRSLCVDFKVKFGRIVRPIGPRWYQVVLDIHVQN
jgi:tRNA (guanine37-N1)-methyltransferase